MSRPGKPSNFADGQPVIGELIAVIDETSPEMGPGVYYVLTTAVMFNSVAITSALATVFDGTPARTRAFHWHKEGPTAGQKLIDIIIGQGVVAHSRYQSLARNKQVHARQTLLVRLADDLHAEGIEHLIVESGDEVTNSRDRTPLLAHFEGRGGVPFRYDWRSKEERLLLIADAPRLTHQWSGHRRHAAPAIDPQDACLTRDNWYLRSLSATFCLRGGASRGRIRRTEVLDNKLPDQQADRVACYRVW